MHLWLLTCSPCYNANKILAQTQKKKKFELKKWNNGHIEMSHCVRHDDEVELSPLQRKGHDEASAKGLATVLTSGV